MDNSYGELFIPFQKRGSLWVCGGSGTFRRARFDRCPPARRSPGAATRRVDAESYRRHATQPATAVEYLRNASSARPAGAREIELAVAAVRKDRQLSDTTRFVTVTLNEPPKEVVRRAKPGSPSPREAFLVLLDNATGRGYEAVVDLGSSSVRRYDAIARRRPAADHARRVRRVRRGGQASRRRSARR